MKHLHMHILLSGLAFAVCLLLAAAQPVRAAAPADGEGPTCIKNFKVFSPVVYTAPVYISGTVTAQGAPVPGQLLELRFYDHGSYDTIASTSTDAGGGYRLVLPAHPQDGQRLYVRWLNPDDNDAWLASWFCNDILSYSERGIACSFDIQDVALVPNPASVTLPFAFQWQMRALDSDSYEYQLQDPANPWRVLRSDPLGYVDSYLLSSLSYKFRLNKPYAWGVTVYGPQGSGKSFYTQAVTFTNRGEKAPKVSEDGERERNNLLLDPAQP